MIPFIPSKNSKTPKSRQKKVSQSRFNKMKERLQYRSHRGKVEVEEPLQSVPPLSGVEPLASVHPEKEEEEIVNETTYAEKKEKNNFFNRASPMKVVRVCKNMTPDQRNLIVAADFTGILGMKCSKLIPELCYYLMECFDPTTSELNFGERGKIPINEESVVKVMAVPNGKYPVPYHSDIEATGLIFGMLGINDGKQPTVASIETQLGPTYPADVDFLRKFVMYVTSSVFAPTTGIQVSPKCYPALINSDAISKLNWAKFIIDILIMTANAKGKKNWFKACMPYLMVLYVDSLETGAVQVPADGPRICSWTNKMIKLVVDLDTKPDGSFGNLPLKACFRKNPCLFSADPHMVDIFIKRHITFNPDEEHLPNYRSAVVNMCNVFEEGLADFIKTLANNKEENVHHKITPKRKRGLNVPVSHDEGGEHQGAVHMADVQTEAPVNEGKPNKRKYVKKAKVKKNIPTDHVVADEGGVTGIAQDSQVPDENARYVNIHSEVTDNVTMDPVEAKKDHISEVSEGSRTDGDAGRIMCDRVDALKHLRIYDSGSQSSTGTTTARDDTSRKQAKEENNISPLVSTTVLSKSKKTVSFADQGNDNLLNEDLVQVSQSGRRPVTRSATQLKPTVHTDVSSSPRRSPRLGGAEGRASAQGQHAQRSAALDCSINLKTPVAQSGGSPSKVSRIATAKASASENNVTGTDMTPGNVGGRRIDQSAMLGISIDLNRALVFNSGSAEVLEGNVQQRMMQELAEDCLVSSSTWKFTWMLPLQLVQRNHFFPFSPCDLYYPTFGDHAISNFYIRLVPAQMF